MPTKNSFITVTDQFCGAGGSSQGARKALANVGIGDEGIKLALNHWQLAIETHNTNFPNTLHDCTDIQACDPRRYPSTDILITSPECTNHSLAKGKKEVKKQMDLFAAGKLDAAAERSRATMWDVARFAEYHNYRAIIVENVVDARKWVMFDAWLQAMYAMGYQHTCVYLNSMHTHPTPQSRDRMYVVFWKKGNKAPMLDYTPLAYSPRIGRDVNAVQTWKNPLKKYGKYRQQYVYCCPFTGDVVEPYYHAAFNCIDWSDPGKRIGDRKTPLADKTTARINYGLDTYGMEPVVINVRHTSGIGFRVKPAKESSIGTMTTHVDHGVCMPFIIKLEHSQRINNLVKADSPLSTQSTRQSSMLISNVRTVTEPVQQQTTSKGMEVAVPVVTEMYGTGKARPVTDPLNTVTAGGVKSGIVTDEKWNAFISSYYSGSIGNTHITRPIGTASTKERHALIQYSKPNIEDCYYRMLKPHEIQLAMAFESDYIVLGDSRQKVKQLGNAVTPPAMEWLVSKVIESLK